MSAVDQTTTDQPIEETEAIAAVADEQVVDATIVLDLGLGEAEALRAWLLKPAGDGTTSLDDPLVSRVLARLGFEVDSARATANVRQELVQSGFAVDHLTDEQVRDLGRRIAEVASPAMRG